MPQYAFLSAAALAGSLFIAEVAQGQAMPLPIRVGQTVTGTLTANDPSIASRGAFHTYRLEAKAGDRYQVTMKSGDVDAYVWVARSVNGLTEEIASDDDGAGDTDARARFRAATAGSYILVAQSLEAGKVGGYELKVEQLPPAPAAKSIAINVGEAKEGTLDDESPLLEDERTEIRYQMYTFSGRGQRVRVSVRSGAFDAFVRVTKVVGGREEEVGTDDDSGGGSDAALVLTASGDYRIYARPLEGDKTGAYTVAVTEVVVRPVASRALAIGEDVRATLAANDPELDDGRKFHQYTISGRPGERFTVTMRSSDIDAYLDWGFLTNNVFESSSTDDDGAGDTDAKLDIVIPAEGSWVLRAHALERGSLGAYTIRVEKRSTK